MNKTIKAALLVSSITLAPPAMADSEWVAPLLGGIILGNVFSGHRHHQQPTYSIYQPPVYSYPVYTPPPRVYYTPPPTCTSYPVFDAYGHYAGQQYRCF